jgi:AcrR family transcriptional regulator
LNKSQVPTENFSNEAGLDSVKRRTALVDVAIRLFSGRPYAEVSIDEIAAEAGVAKGLLYYHFGNKRGLYVAGLERLARQLNERLATAVGTGGTPVEQLMAGLDAHLSFIEQHPDGYREMVNGAATHPEVRAILDGEEATIRDMLIAGLPAEVPRGPAVKLAIEGWGAFVDGILLAWLADKGMARDRVNELCGRMLVSAVTAAMELEKQPEAELS